MKYIEQALPALNDKFEEIYLLKNIRHFTLYTFEEGRSFQPDFLLHLKENIDNEPLIYHVFIELNKAQSSKNDSKIKERFLEQVQQEYRLETLFKDRTFRLLGMPFNNEVENRTTFYKALQAKLQ